MKNITSKVFAACLAGVSCVGAAFADGFRVEDGKIVVDSPFDLEIGSTEYAQALGSHVETHDYVHADDYYAQARFSQPYFGADGAGLSFSSDDGGKTLSTVSLSYWSESGRGGGKLSFGECRAKYDEIAADIAKRLGVEMDTSGDDDPDEEEVLESVAEMERLKDDTDAANGRKETHKWGISFRSARSVVKGRHGDVEYNLTAIVWNDKMFSIDLSMSRPLFTTRPSVCSVRNDGHIPVYTNRSNSAGFSLPVTDEQQKAHEEAAALRATVKRLFGVDLDATSVTNNLSAALSAQTNNPAQPEWRPLERPFAGCTERSLDQTAVALAIPMTIFAVRHPFDGDVGEDVLKTESQKILDAFERELGAKIPELETAAKSALPTDGAADAEPPAFGDLFSMLPAKSGDFFTGSVGDVRIGIRYAVPSYVKRNGKYEVAVRGAVVVQIVQLPFLARQKKSKETEKGKGVK